MYFSRISQFILATFLTLHLFSAHASNPKSVYEKLSVLETSSGGRIGISAINTENNERIQYREHERFRTGSTFKVLGVAAALKKSMQDKKFLQQHMHIGMKAVTSWSPITQKHINESMTISDLSAAAMMYSDNTAIQLVMKKLGGPQQVIDFSRSIGDEIFMMNNTTDFLNPTSTPEAMEESLRKLTLEKILGDQQRRQLIAWMKDNTTGNLRIRAGVPKGWVVADKTGSGNYGLTNDIAVIWPPDHAPIVVVIYFDINKEHATSHPAVLAEATRIILNEFTLST